MVLYFDCKDNILVERLLSRGATSGRLDDNEATIKKRLSLFHDKTEPVIKHYEDIVEKVQRFSYIVILYFIVVFNKKVN